MVAAVAVLTYLGPFGTWGALSAPDRVAFWALATGVNWLFAMLAGAAAVRVFERRGWPAWAGVVVVGSALAAVPGTGVAWLLVAAYFGYRMASLYEVASLYAKVIGLHLILNGIVTSLIVRRRAAGGTVPGVGAAPCPWRGPRRGSRRCVSRADSRPPRAQPAAPAHAGPLCGDPYRRGE